MKKIYYVILLLAVMSNTAAQDKYEPTNSDFIVANDMETFIDLFENQNVGNLHCYSRLPNVDNSNYFFQGQIIAPKFEKHLSSTIKRKIKQTNNSPFATGAIRGKNLDNDFYILRVPKPNNTDLLILTKVHNNKLTSKKELAYFRKKKKKYHQMDSWLQDLNGDTKLDLIQKKRIMTKEGKILNEKTTVYLQKPNGKFKKSKNTNIEKSDYKMQLWK